MRRPARPAGPDDTSPYTELGALQADSEWPLGGPQDAAEPRPVASSLPPFLVGLIVGVALAAVTIVGFVVFRRDDGGTTATPPAAATTAATTTTETADTAAAVTSIDIPTTEAPVVTIVPEPIPAIGDPLSLDDLAMGSSGLGDLVFGDDGTTVLGRLVATFGQPDEDTGTFISTGAYGTCDGDPARFVRWGPLGVIILNPDASPTFSAYRLDIDFGNLESLTADLRTVSGLRGGDSIATLEAIYADTYTITYEVGLEAGLEFQLRASDGSLLLHGPVTSADPDGRVSGIYSPDACTL